MINILFLNYLKGDTSVSIVRLKPAIISNLDTRPEQGDLAPIRIDASVASQSSSEVCWQLPEDEQVHERTPRSGLTVGFKAMPDFF